MNLADLWAAVFTHLWQSSFVLLALLGLARLLRGAPARYEHTLWSIGLAKLLLPLAAGGAVIRWLLPPAIRGQASFSLDPVWADPGAGLALALAGEPVLRALTIAWGAGCAFLLFRLAREQARASRLRRGGRVPTGAEAHVVDAARNGTDVPGHAIRVTEAPVGPSVVGLRRPVILLGRATLALPVAELRVILEHEDAHRRRRDPVRILVRRIAAAVLFFYPPIVPLMRRLHETAEFAADEHALRASNPALLARALAQVVRLGLVAAPDPAAGGNAALLSRRFARLATPWRKPMPVHRFALVTAVTLTLAASLLPVASADGPGAKEEVAFDTPPAVTHQVAPVYPKDSRDVSGRVLIELTVTTEGEATELEVIEGIEGRPEFSEAATDAITQWRFSPARKDGKAVPARILVPIQFALDDTKKSDTPDE